MKIHEEGQILELDSSKQYWMFVKAGSLLAKVVRNHGIKSKSGQIIFTGNLDEFKFVENSDRIKGIVIKEFSEQRDPKEAKNDPFPKTSKDEKLG